MKLSCSKSTLKKNGLNFNEHEFVIYTLYELIVGGETTDVYINYTAVTAGGLTYPILL